MKYTTIATLIGASATVLGMLIGISLAGVIVENTDRKIPAATVECSRAALMQPTECLRDDFIKHCLMER